ncbi:semaphorin-7A [Sphaeramia orbicularis]|uniref:Semaphorin-7A-like n=1 Tax=Sphaeramia orbicularis TaxID=375764 RepID=A0A672Z5D7_9TELE|nr:semaphorin-7A-like [Sphaeramia orbicularis]
MELLRLEIYLLFSCLSSFSEASLTHFPRMTFTGEESTMTKMPLHFLPLKILMEAETDVVTAVGGLQINTFNFHTEQAVERTVEWEDCISSGAQQRDCSYNITVAHKMEGNYMFVCGSNGRETLCCNMSTAETSAKCVPSNNVRKIKESIREFSIKGHEQSALVESAGDDDFYITVSGSQDYVGINKFGRHRVGPVDHDKEQYYVGLMVGRQVDPGQDKVYAFYKEKNEDPGLDNEMWLPFVTQVCMSDIGGPKNNMQFSWTSQLNARLFCGDPVNRKHYSELVDVATVPAENWMDTRVYALFRNEWGISAVCVYNMQDIDQTFRTSPFKGSDRQHQRPRTCVSDSTKIPLEILRLIKTTSEMEDWVQPVDSSGPLHHNYTHISVDNVEDKMKNSHRVLFLSLHNGGVHKVMQSKNQTFIIAEYRPFGQRAHIHGITLNPSSRKLYVSSRGQLVQLDVADCAQYGDTCEDCVLARDPYCSWINEQCTAETQGEWQDVEHGNSGICKSVSKTSKYLASASGILSDDTITLPLEAKYFLSCPISSHHAEYTWNHPESTTSCNPKDQQCLHLIDRMSHEQVGTYLCVSKEMGYTKVLAKYQLQLESRAGSWSSGMLVWVCLVAALLVLT